MMLAPDARRVAAAMELRAASNTRRQSALVRVMPVSCAILVDRNQFRGCRHT
jgi:hypothetical protein